MKMDESDLLFIEDNNSRRLYYRFTPALLISNFVPLVVILHDEEGRGAHHFEYKMWNVLTPVNQVDEDKALTWVGTKGDHSISDLLQKLIADTAEEHECEEHIYFYGSGVGAYSAMKQALASEAKAAYLKNPLINLAQISVEHSTLISLQDTQKSNPIFYVCNAGMQLNEEILSFILMCKEKGLKFHDYCSTASDDAEEEIKDVLKFFEKMISQD